MVFGAWSDFPMLMSLPYPSANQLLPKQSQKTLGFWYSGLDEFPLSLPAIAVLTHLLRRCGNSENSGYPSIATIAKARGISARTVIRAIKELERAGIIIVKRSSGSVSRYAIRSAEEWKKWRETIVPFVTGDKPATGDSLDHGPVTEGKYTSDKPDIRSNPLKESKKGIQEVIGLGNTAETITSAAPVSLPNPKRDFFIGREVKPSAPPQKQFKPNTPPQQETKEIQIWRLKADFPEIPTSEIDRAATEYQEWLEEKGRKWSQFPRRFDRIITELSFRYRDEPRPSKFQVELDRIVFEKLREIRLASSSA
jgi:DNA-binding MarR family transcriptional regulator